MEIKPVPALPDMEHRQFIRCVVWRYPVMEKNGMLSPYAGEWGFRLDMILGRVQHNYTWHQPPQDEEPSPNPELFAMGLDYLNKALLRHGFIDNLPELSDGLRSPSPAV